jgi:hypothetical protein
MMTIHFVPVRNTTGKVCDAELHFSHGPLKGLKLVGFGVWERKSGGRNVTFPARSYKINGEVRSFALLRPSVDADGHAALTATILDAYAIHERTTVSQAGTI